MIHVRRLFAARGRLKLFRLTRARARAPVWMMCLDRRLSLGLGSLVLLSLFYSSLFTGARAFDKSDSTSRSFSHVVLFSWDGVQYDHLIELYQKGNLTNLKQLINETRLPILRTLTTDHLTLTNNAHASILSGVGQGAADGCPDNITIWENIENMNSTWMTGAVAGKAKFTGIIFPYAHSDVDFWYAADTSASHVTDIALSFIHNYSRNNFFLFIHYREPDWAGHSYGENSSNYDNAIIECDTEMGKILNSLEVEGIGNSTAVLVTTDHGFQENGYGHTSPAWGASNANPALYTTWIACNRGSVDQTYSASNYWDQNDVAPTIYDLIGIDDYSVRWPYIRGSALWHRSFRTRDIAVTEVRPSSNVTIGGTLMLNVTIQNQGDFTEIPTIVLYCNNSVIGTRTLVYPDPPLSSRDRGESVQTISFIWNTTGLQQGTYEMSANASVIQAGGTNHPSLAYTQNETDTEDNSAISPITITVLSTDINDDGAVNILDITIVAKAFGSKKGEPMWNELADLDKNEIVNILDISMVAKDYGKSS